MNGSSCMATEDVLKGAAEAIDVEYRTVVAPGVKVKDGIVSATEGSNLGMLFQAVLELLINRSDPKVKWVHKRMLSGRWSLLLSEAQGQSIPWKKIGVLCGDWRGSGCAPPVVNFSRGFKILCRKSMLVTTLRQYEEQHPTSNVSTWLPPSFVFYPAKSEKSEKTSFLAAVSARTDSNTWILKPSDGGKGERIKIMRSKTVDGVHAHNIIEFLEQQPEGSISWVVSEYLERPLLLPGERKFDWRLWVYLDAKTYDVRLWREGVFRTCSVPFNMDNLEDEFSHLSNHCIQVLSAEYGKHESTNEMFYDEFECIVGVETFQQNLLPQARHIIHHTLEAARDTLLIDPELTGVTAFNVFGFDLMVDADYQVKLIEVNSSPAVAEELLEPLVHDLAELISPSLSQPHVNGWEPISL